jgi:TolB protein
MMLKHFLIILLFIFITALSGCQDGNSIAFSRLTGDYWQIWTMRPDGKSARQITFSPSDKRYPVWTADGRKLLCHDNDNRALTVDINNGYENRILKSFDRVGKVTPSPDGSKLLFVRFRTELMDSSDLWLTSIDGGDQKILTRDAGLQYDPEWSPDESKIVYVSGHGYQTHELYLMDSDGKNKKRLTENKALDLLPAFSPDGRRIAYVSDATGDFEIWVMNADGTDKKRLSNSEGIDTRPRWSPDGKHIMFVSNRTGSLQLWIMRSDGTDPVQITKGAPSNDPDWRKISK